MNWTVSALSTQPALLAQASALDPLDNVETLDPRAQDLAPLRQAPVPKTDTGGSQPTGQAQGNTPRPISSDPRHPANQEGRTVYLGRSGGGFGGKSLSQRVDLFKQAMLAAGPQGNLAIEIQGTFGNYAQAQVLLPLSLAIKKLPPNQVPRIEWLVSGGHTAADSPFGQFLQTNPGGKPGVVAQVTEDDTAKLIPNWGNPAVVERYVQDLATDLESAKQLGLPTNVGLDDHMGLRGLVDKLSSINGSGAPSGQRILADAIGKIAATTHAEGGEFTLSLVGDFNSSASAGINPNLLPPRTVDRLEIQAYRSNVSGVESLVNAVSSRFRSVPALKDAKELRFVLINRANGQDISESTSIQQQAVLNNLARQYSREGGPRVNVALWTGASFYDLRSAPR